MGYTTEFHGSIEVVPPLSAEEVSYLNKFSDSRRMSRTTSPYYVDGKDDPFTGKDADVIDYNTPSEGQPGLWCNWIATPDGKAIEWNESEKFYESAEWMKYIITHFLDTNPQAKTELPFLQGHTLNGTIAAQGEESEDRWDLIVKDNKVFVVDYESRATGEREI